MVRPVSRDDNWPQRYITPELHELGHVWELTQGLDLVPNGDSPFPGPSA